MKPTKIILGTLAMAAMLAAGSLHAEDRKNLTQPEANYQAGSSPIGDSPMYQSMNPKAPAMTQAEFDTCDLLFVNAGFGFFVTYTSAPRLL